MPASPQISVVMTAYNHELFVGDAIQSVLDQDFQDWELVIRDDGSADGTAGVIASFRDPRIRFLGTGRNLGASLSANECIKVARGEYVAILNSDDVFEPHKLRVQHDFMTAHPGVGAVFSQASLISEDGSPYTRWHPYSEIFNKTNRSRHEWLRYFFTDGNCLCDPSVLVRKEVYDTVGLYDARFASLPDFDLWIRVCLRYEIHVLPDRLVRFRIRANEENESGQRPANLVRLHTEMFHCLAKFRQLSSADFLRVFPGVAAAHEDGWFDAEFYFALHCLAQSQVYLRSYGEQLLHEIACDEARMAAISAHTGFGYRDLHSAMASIDLFHVASPAYRAATRLVFGPVASPTYVADAVFELGARGGFECAYEIPASIQSAGEVCWQPPAGMPCVIAVHSVEQDGRPVEIEPENADHAQDGAEWFHRPDPRYRLPALQLAGPASIRIRGSFRLLESNDLVAEIKGHVTRGHTLSREVNSLHKRMKSLEKENQTLNTRLDKIAHSPLRAFGLWWKKRHSSEDRHVAAAGHPSAR